VLGEPSQPKISTNFTPVAANFTAAGIGSNATQEEAARPPTIWDPHPWMTSSATPSNVPAAVAKCGSNERRLSVEVSWKELSWLASRSQVFWSGS
jgi:hypothetical protein